MKSKKRILVVQADQVAGVALESALASEGIKTILISRRSEVAAVFETTSIDLVLVSAETEPKENFEFAGELKRARPNLPVVMLLKQLELSLVVQGIRQGLTDVLPSGTDLAPMVQRLRVLLADREGADPTAEELAVAEATLAQLDPAYVKPAPGHTVAQLERRLQQQLRELQSEREQVAAAQEAVDTKARSLAKEREAMQRECRELKAERKEWEQTLSELEVREENLIIFETKLRERQQKMDTAQSQGGVNLPGTAIDLGKAWEAYNKAAKTLAAERAIVRDERMVLADLDKKVKERRVRLDELNAQIAGHELTRRASVGAVPKAFAKPATKARTPMKAGFFRSILGGVR